jgi:hypothetical protein
MPKIITVKRREGESDRAREYVRTHILIPSALLGLIFVVAGTAALLYQFMTEPYGWGPFLETTALLLTGLAFGWAQTRYHRYLLREHPAHFAGRMRLYSKTPLKRTKREPPVQQVRHPGRRLVPWAYLAGILSILGASTATATFGHLYYIAAFFLPWVGFFWAKLFFWRGALKGNKN